MANITPYFVNPEESINPGNTRGEGKSSEATLYKMLRDQMPNDWYAIWKNELGEHEYDFLVAVPGCGVVNLECKGYYTADSNNGSFIAPDGRRKYPISQACGAIGFYNQEVARIVGVDQWGLYGYAVVFPEYDFEDKEGNLRNFLGKPIYTKSDCQRLGIAAIVREALRKAEDRVRNSRNFNGTVSYLSVDNARKIWDEWCRVARPVLPEARNADIEHVRNIMRAVLTYAQKAALRKIHESKCVHVKGSAGTGKTLLAVRAAQDAQDKSVVYVCYNQLIAEEVKIQAKKAGLQNLEVHTFHSLDKFCLDRDLKVYVKEPDGQRRLDEAATDREFVSAVYNAGSKRRYDLLLVDEGQDFNVKRFEFLMCLLKPSGSRFVLFSDSEQAIYQNPDFVSDEELLKLFPNMEDVRLDDNIRNTVEIASYCQDCIPQEKLAESSIDGVKVENFSHSCDGLNEWIAEKFLPEFRPDNVAVLSDSVEFINQFRCTIHGKPFYGKAEKANDSRKNLERWHKGECGWKSSINAFKGLEADVVILVLFGNQPGNAQAAVRYVGASRARYQLIVIEVSSAA